MCVCVCVRERERESEREREREEGRGAGGEQLQQYTRTSVCSRSDCACHKYPPQTDIDLRCSSTPRLVLRCDEPLLYNYYYYYIRSCITNYPTYDNVMNLGAI